MHLLPKYGSTVSLIEQDGFQIGARVPIPLLSDQPLDIARAMGAGTIGFAEAYSATAIDLLLLLGDRFEMHAAAVAAVPFGITVAHLHGGELTLGAFDDALRHSITKLSHYHFVALPEYARRVIQMGEEPWRVLVSGAPSLDSLKVVTPLTRRELELQFGLDLAEPPLLVTFHPVTLEYRDAGSQVDELLAALDTFGAPVVFSGVNADTGHVEISGRVKQYLSTHPNARLVENFGTRAYFGLMACARAMAGNSSSGLLEAASFRLPVVNVGTRQDGRVRPPNVADVACMRADILAALHRVDTPAFRQSIASLDNPYGSGDAAAVIVEAIKRVPVGDLALRKQFRDLPA